MHAKSALLLLAAAPLALMAGRAMAQMVDVPAVAETQPVPLGGASLV